MKIFFLFLFALLLNTSLFGQEKAKLIEREVVTKIDSSYENELTLIQEFIVNVGIDSVWNAYTTKKGWESWAVPKADIDFKVNGLIQTNYNRNGTIGDSSTITLHIINYVPKQLITLQAELNNDIPAFLKADEEDLYNVILFEEISKAKTKVTSFGIGYKNNDSYKSVINFFIAGNTQTYLKLITYLETGESMVK